MARGRSFNRGGARPRRPMDWVTGEIDSTVSGNATPEALCGWLCAAQLRNDFTDPTLMALRVWGSAIPVGATTGANSVFAMGLIAWNFTLAPDGSANIPSECPLLINDPFADSAHCQDEDWIYQWFLPSAGGETSSNIHYIEAAERVSKARRRLGNDSGILFVVQALGTSYQYHFHARALIKE